MFLALYKDQNILEPTKTYFIENIIELPIAVKLRFIFADKLNILRICQNTTTTPGTDQIPINNGEYHTSKSHIHRRIKETIRRIKDCCNRPGMNKDIEM